VSTGECMNIVWGHDMGGAYQTNIANSIYGQSLIYTTSTTNNTNPNSTLVWGTEAIAPSNLTNRQLVVEGDSEFKGDVKIKGKSLLDKLESIEDRLAILHPNPELEEKWENLRGLRKMYMDLEKEILEQEKMWAILKK